MKRIILLSSKQEQMNRIRIRSGMTNQDKYKDRKWMYREISALMKFEKERMIFKTKYSN